MEKKRQHTANRGQRVSPMPVFTDVWYRNGDDEDLSGRKPERPAERQGDGSVKLLHALRDTAIGHPLTISLQSAQ